jgi:general secretion pathway protein A
MYNSYFGFSQSPFENNLDQRFLFLSQDHREVLAALLYFVETNKGFAIVCGDVATGKSMLINAFWDRLPDSVQPIMMLTPVRYFSGHLNPYRRNLESQSHCQRRCAATHR